MRVLNKMKYIQVFFSSSFFSTN